ncbi:MAG TPA: DUF6691 family protein [Kofleriaceae bacterium]
MQALVGGALIATSLAIMLITTGDIRLIGGASVFGVGWGLSGFCPGPAIVSLVSGTTASFVFVGAMLAAMLVVDRRTARADG